MRSLINKGVLVLVLFQLSCATPYNEIPPPDPGPLDGLGVLVFTKIAGFRHNSIETGVATLQRIGEERGWTVIETQNGAAFNAEFLSRFDVVVWLSTTWDVLNLEQEKAFESFIEGGGGYVGVHAASDTEYEWEWYSYLVGAYLTGHPSFPNIRNADVFIEDPDHPTTFFLPQIWNRDDEWYSFDKNPRDNPSLRILASLDEGSYDPGNYAMGDHPVIWCQEVENGRAFYTALGHTAESFSERNYLLHLTAAIEWAAGSDSLITP